MSLTTYAIVILGLWVIGIVVAGLVMALRPGGVGVKFSSGGLARTAVPGTNRQEIPLGGDAQTLGNLRGRVEAVLLQPDTRQLVAVQLGGLLETETVPAEAILGADGNTLSLSDGWQDHVDEVGAGTAILRDGMAIVDPAGKRLGRLRVVCYDPGSSTVTAVVFEGRGISDRRLVPMDQVTEAGPDRVVTSVRNADTGRLQVFATDWDLRQAILERLAGDPALQALQRALRIEVRDQRVRVQGFVADRARANQIEQAIREVPGVLGLDSDLTSDDQLAQAVRDAIARDPATSAAQVDVVARSGVVDITGIAPDRATVRRIDSVTQQVEGPQVIHNMVTVRASSPQPAPR